MSTRNLRVLLVEDNPADVRLTQEALRGAKFTGTLRVARDGAEAIEYLQRSVAGGEGGFDGEGDIDGAGVPTAQYPDLILLDLNLPRRDGREVLREIKSHERTTSIPVVVLTTSDSPLDVTACYGLHANAFVTKPRDFEEFETTVARISEFFAVIAARPRAAAAVPRVT